MNLDLSHFWQKGPIVAVDIETTGKYPLEAKICELAAVKYVEGEVVDTYQTLVDPQVIMGNEVIAIHNITNKMVMGKPTEEEVVQDFFNFVSGSIFLAHHAPFDLGFLSLAFEENGLNLPKSPALCSSLLARNIVTQTPNHRLQTLAKHFKIEQKSAHRALEDARVCLQVTENMLNGLGSLSLEDVFCRQRKKLFWSDYSIKALEANVVLEPVIAAIKNKQAVEITYDGGSRKGQPRVVFPRGLVRNPDGDFIIAKEKDQKEKFLKRYFLKKVIESRVC